MWGRGVAGEGGPFAGSEPNTPCPVISRGLTASPAKAESEHPASSATHRPGRPAAARGITRAAQPAARLAGAAGVTAGAKPLSCREGSGGDRTGLAQQADGDCPG